MSWAEPTEFNPHALILVRYDENFAELQVSKVEFSFVAVDQCESQLSKNALDLVVSKNINVLVAGFAYAHVWLKVTFEKNWQLRLISGC